MITLHSLYDEVRQEAKTMSFGNLTIIRDVKANLYPTLFLSGKKVADKHLDIFHFQTMPDIIEMINLKYFYLILK